MFAHLNVIGHHVDVVFGGEAGLVHPQQEVVSIHVTVKTGEND